MRKVALGNKSPLLFVILFSIFIGAKIAKPQSQPEGLPQPPPLLPRKKKRIQCRLKNSSATRMTFLGWIVMLLSGREIREEALYPIFSSPVVDQQIYQFINPPEEILYIPVVKFSLCRGEQ